VKTISNIAAFVKYSREKLNLTQEQLADMANVGLHFIRNLEQGRSALRVDKVNEVLKVFGHSLRVSTDELDPYQMWANYFDKAVKIVLNNEEALYGFLVQELRDEKSNIVAWKVVPNVKARDWQKKPDDLLTVTVKHNEIREIELQKG
jgi:y4mF family transcriptional regulator